MGRDIKFNERIVLGKMKKHLKWVRLDVTEKFNSRIFLKNFFKEMNPFGCLKSFYIPQSSNLYVSPTNSKKSFKILSKWSHSSLWFPLSKFFHEFNIKRSLTKSQFYELNFRCQSQIIYHKLERHFNNLSLFYLPHQYCRSRGYEEKTIIYWQLG